MKSLHLVTFTLLVIGGLSLLLEGLFGWEIADIFGGEEMLVSRAIFVLIGLSAIYEIAIHKGACKLCGTDVK